MISGALRRLSIQVVAEDTVGYDSPYLGQHGISILLTAESDAGICRVLVDVAQNPEALLENMRLMGIDPHLIDARPESWRPWEKKIFRWSPTRGCSDLTLSPRVP